MFVLLSVGSGNSHNNRNSLYKYIYKRIVTYYVGLSSHGLWGLVWSLKTAYPKIKMGKKIKEHKLHRGVFTTFRLEE